MSRAARLRPSISNETVENKVIRGAKLGARFRESRLKTSAKGLNFHKVEIALEKERTQVEDVRLDATLEGRRQHQVAAVGRPAALDQRLLVHTEVHVGADLGSDLSRRTRYGVEDHHPKQGRAQDVAAQVGQSLRRPVVARRGHGTAVFADPLYRPPQE